MGKWFLLVIVVIVIALWAEFSRKKGKPKVEYKYQRKQFFLTSAEHKFYDALIAAVGHSYYVFAQVHLPTIIDNKVVGQNWRGAFRHIDEKSVDFVLCDKAYISPKLAIELDDSSHLRPDRQERDKEVERILNGAGLPLLRMKLQGQISSSEITQRVNEALQPRPKPLPVADNQK